MNGQHPTQFLTTKQAAAHLNVSKNFLDKDRLTRIHGIPFCRLGKKILYNIEDLNAFMQKMAVM